MVSTQVPLISLMNKFGYKVPQKGVCAGLICLVAFAEICEEEAKFDRRIDLILNLNAEKITYNGLTDSTKMLPIIREKIKKKEKLTPFEKNIMDLDAFFSSITIAHFTDNFKEFFNGFIAKADIVRLAEVIRPEKLVARGGIQEVFADPFIGNEKKLKKYLTQLSAIFTQCEKNTQGMEYTKLSFSLYSPLHRISIKYIPAEQCWTITDPNTLPARKISLEQLVQEIIKAFHDNQITAFEAQIYTAGKNPYLEQVKSQFNQLKQSNELKKETVKTATLKNDYRSGGTTIAHIAAMNGDVDTLKKITKLDKKSLFRADNDGYTPMIYAAQYGYIEVVDYLASVKNSELVRVTDLGMSALSIASHMQHTNVLAMLQKHPDLLRDSHADIESLVFTAAINLKYDSLFTLADLNKDFLRRTNAQGETPVHLLIRRGISPDILLRLTAYDVDFTCPSHQANSPLSIAIKDKRWDLVMVMMLHTSASATMMKQQQIKYELITSELFKHLDNLENSEQRDDIIRSIAKKTNLLGQYIFDESKQAIKSNHGLFKENKPSFKDVVLDLKNRFSPEHKANSNSPN
ncbi:ankyrin repeat domain-containing protein [Legionella bononiensis]|uniref:Ankyrin repeat domain-containing protein n=1 Tax=Legionella bononiensis TaxID=2793102 RepID=A0ABS1WAN8_9GAMM|nr:ankyrin repeat domain-containing protein [Legionella bononiensis]MBL7480348.1 ankyrin repeat domain-containing protein [Legionella bononiensis]MBL7526420.1 ankyrin repeat domain-containing protein [Legionella bononiensis]MBL7563086.1 ankyrin repeat domain-containing protein [Legionella bononiensis]